MGVGTGRVRRTGGDRVRAHGPHVSVQCMTLTNMSLLILHKLIYTYIYNQDRGSHGCCPIQPVMTDGKLVFNA